MKANKRNSTIDNKQTAKKAVKMKAKTDEIVRWESEGGAFIPTGQLPNAQQVKPDAQPTDTPHPQR